LSSKILVDELAGKTAAGNITITSEGGSATMQLQQGLGKHFCTFNMSTPSVLDSFNQSSLLDDSTGQFSCNFTNSMNSANYSPFMNSNNYVTTFNDWSAVGQHVAGLDANTSRCTAKAYNSVYIDAQYNSCAVLGDLA